MIRTRGSGSGPVPAAYALPKPLLGDGAASSNPANPYALPRPLLAKDETDDDAYTLPKPLLNSGPESPGARPPPTDVYAVPSKARAGPEPPSRASSASSSTGGGSAGDVYAVPHRTLPRSGEHPSPTTTTAGPALPPRQLSSSSSGLLSGSPHDGIVAPPPAPRRSLTLPGAVLLSGNEVLAQFLNQTFHRVNSVMFADRPTFRTRFALPSGCGPASNQYLHLYYHEKNFAWAVGLKLGSMGVLAYRPGRSLTVPCDQGQGQWHIANEKGKFVPVTTVQCIAVDGEPVAPLDETSGSRSEGTEAMLPAGSSREDAQAALQHNRTPGSFVVRESTSVTNSYVITVMGIDLRLQHLRCQATSRGLSLGPEAPPFRSLRSLIEFYSREPLPDSRGLRLGRCFSGEQLYEALPQ
eukprot:m.40481 g.40481  ORF g.40481 m.40481 type:complete len:410 (+) comp10339_c1_seq1:497-1726(+)